MTGPMLDRPAGSYSGGLLRAMALALSVAAAVGTAGAEIPDPTRPATESPAQESAGRERPDWQVTMIRIKEDGTPVAWINGVRVQEGDRVDGARVQSLSMSAVNLLWQGEMVELRLREQIRLNTAPQTGAAD